MKIDYVFGNKKVFTDFLKNINKKDKIAILTHIDLDGIASAVFLEKILESKGFKANTINFINYEKGIFLDQIKKLKEKQITKVFLTDLYADQLLDEFEEFTIKFDTLLIDHHPINPDLKNKDKMIKTISDDCIGFVLYELSKDFYDVEKLDWLLDATLVSEWSFKAEKHMNYLNKKYPGINIADPNMSEPGKLSIIIDYALKYYEDFEKVFSFVKKKDIVSLEKGYKIVNDEFEKVLFQYKKEEDFYSKIKLHFCLVKFKFNIASAVVTKLSRETADTYAIAYERGNGFVRINFRNQGKDKDMGMLVKKGISGLKDATAGGHFNAAAALIRKEDIAKFKKNILA